MGTDKKLSAGRGSNLGKDHPSDTGFQATYAWNSRLTVRGEWT